MPKVCGGRLSQVPAPRRQAHAADKRWSVAELVAHRKELAELERMHERYSHIEVGVNPVVMRKRVHDTLIEVLWQILAVMIMLVGTAAKQALYDPTSPADKWNAIPSRGLLVVPLGIAFTIELLQNILLANWHYYRRASLRLVPTARRAAHFSLLVARAGLTGRGCLELNAHLAFADCVPAVTTRFAP